MRTQSISKRLRLADAPRTVFGDVLYERGSAFGPRIQRDYQLIVLEEGQVRAEIEGVERIVKTGEVALLLPEKKERFAFAEDRISRHTWCAVSPLLVSEELQVKCEAAPPVLPLSRRFSQLMEMGLSLPTLALGGSHGLTESLGMAVLQEYLFSWRRSVTPHRDDSDAVRRAIAWINTDGNDVVDLRSLARIAGVSAAQLVKLFKRHLGTTPMRYVWESRTRRGSQLLRETGLTVSEIAYRCGFQTPFHFSRWVKQIHGVSPKAMREREWQGRT